MPRAKNKVKISLLVPCYNEEKSLRASICAALKQTRPFDEMVFIDDSSKDATPEILASFGSKITAKRTPKNTGNKSSAQEFGMQFITGDIVVTTDADTLLDKDFVKQAEKSFEDEKVVAVAGHVKSLPYNWLTLCRAFEYIIGQNIHKMAQDHLGYIFVMPGAASAFRTKLFKEHITFDHDTITEDLDFTYKMHKNNLKIIYNEDMISYTQDPADLKNYINQMRRWFGGGWQNLLKHYNIIITTPIRAAELALLYSEGLIFSVLVFVLPLLNIYFEVKLIIGYFIVSLSFAIWAAWKEKRIALVLAPFPYLILVFINSYIYLEQFIKEIILKRRNLVWFKPERVDINTN